MDFLTNVKRGRYSFDDEHPENTFKSFFWSLFCALVIITICSRSSFLYVYNLWDDANSYFTMGKCIFRGFVPYRDLFDQKGIMLYFIYGLASLISATTFKGVYIMEIIAAGLSLFAVFKIFELFLDSEIMPYLLTPLTGAVMYSAIGFYWGGSAEEFLFPFILWGLYLSVRYFRNDFPEAMDYKTVLIGGVLAGCVLNIKFNSLGFFFAWMAVVFFADIIGSREIAKAFISCLVFLGGMLAATLPWIIYFGVNLAIDDWAYVYIYKNVFEYSKKVSLGERAYLFYDIIKNHALNNKLVFIFVFVGIAYFIASAIHTAVKGSESRLFLELKISELVNLGMLLFFLVLVIFIGGVSLPYYIFPMNAFVLFGFVPLGFFFKDILEDNAEGRLLALISGCSVIIAFVICWFLSVNVKSIKLSEDDLFLFKFRNYIEKSGVEDPGIIVEFTFDVGLYTVLDVEPICYYYQTQTLNMDEVIEYQKQYLHSGEADFVVTKDTEAEGIGDRYDLVMQDRCVFHDFDHVYYLYQRNQTPVE